MSLLPLSALSFFFFKLFFFFFNLHNTRKQIIREPLNTSTFASVQLRRLENEILDAYGNALRDKTTAILDNARRESKWPAFVKAERSRQSHEMLAKVNIRPIREEEAT
ncbi:hypothetical protein PUN28_011693 [Cardiocondyla obscurior]|uniref:Uncharacterized protein n=1 Tax=Cardiocondyla obscurior TaxID=286306 RepID=A0AAW2FK75_9HYME